MPVQIKELGSGSFGQCMLAEDHDGENVAVKFIERGKVRLHPVIGVDTVRACLCTFAGVRAAGRPERRARSPHALDLAASQRHWIQAGAPQPRLKLRLMIVGC